MPIILQARQGPLLTMADFRAGSVLAAAMLVAWVAGSAGMSLVATFVPGILFAWALFAWLYFGRIPLPGYRALLRIYYPALGWQLVHFTEELLTGFRVRFPDLYAGQAYTAGSFVAFNLVSYLVFAVSPLLVYRCRMRFLVVPLLFFIGYGAMGNAVAHACWSICRGGYFPGLITSLLYWIIGPLCLGLFLKSKQTTAAFIIIFSLVLTLSLVLFMA